MKNIPIITFLLCFSHLTFMPSGFSARAQSIPASQPVRAAQGPDSTLAQALRFTDSVFNRPDFTYDIAEPDIPKDMQSILIRFSDAVSANKEWFIDYRNKYATSGQSLPYNERFGITRDEYRRVQQLEKLPPRLVTVSRQQVTVSRQNNDIGFKSDGESVILGYLEIDLQRQKVIFAGDTLLFAGAMDASQLSPLRLGQCYTWRLEKADLKNTLQTDKVTARVVEVDLGLPLDPGKIFLRIKYQDMQAGVMRTDMDLTGFVH
jgi:hypothetical protein